MTTYFNLIKMNKNKRLATTLYKVPIKLQFLYQIPMKLQDLYQIAELYSDNGDNNKLVIT